MSNGNILVVDDTIANLELLEGILDDHGYDVRTAISGESALKSIEAQTPDIILLDIMMPGINGYETCKIIKDNDLTKEVPVIFLSAKSEMSDKVHGFEVGGVDYIVKPFDISEVIVRVKTHLSNYFLKKELTEKVNIIDKYVISSSTDKNGVITHVSEALCNISGYTKNELIGKNHKILKHPDMKEEVYKDVWNTIHSGNTWKGEFKNLKKDGEFYWVSAVISPVYDSDNNITGYTSIRQDITNQKIIEMLSITDQLTSLFNRRHFNDIFPVEIKRAIRNGFTLSLIMLDVDFFKQYNDTYGHQDGDNVLEAIGTTLKKELNRSEDFSFRLGGEEFGIVCTTNNCQGALTIADKVRTSIEALNIEHKNSKVEKHVTASFGIACIDFSKKGNYDLTMDDIYKLADDELYKAKESGRNRVSVNSIN